MTYPDWLPWCLLAALAALWAAGGLAWWWLARMAPEVEDDRCDS